MARIAGVILAGGKSLRMGTDKALLKYRGNRMIDHIEAVFRTAGIENIFVSGEYEGFDCIYDKYPNAGPVGGICSIINALYGRFTRVVILPIDLPNISPIIVRNLQIANDKMQAVYFENEPLPLFLKLDMDINLKCSEINSKLVAGASFSVKQFLAQLNCQILPISQEIKSCLTNTNSPEDWAKVLGNE